MKIKTLTYLLLLLLSVVQQGCIYEDAPVPEAGSGTPVSIFLKLPDMALTAAPDAAITDKTIARVRILAFRQDDPERCALNRFIDTPSAPFEFKVEADTYDFYFLINEPLSRRAELDGLASRRQLDGLRIATADLCTAPDGTSSPTPNGLYAMFATQGGVLVAPDYTRPPDAQRHFPATVTYRDADGVLQDRKKQLSVKARRLAARVNIRLVRKNNPNTLIPYTDVEEIKIMGLPGSVPVLETVLSDLPATGEVPMTEATLDNYPADAGGSPTYAGYTAVVPSYLFAPRNNKAQAAKLYLKLKDDGRPRSMALGHSLETRPNDPNADYNLHRNTIYHARGRVSDKLDLDISVSDWNELNLTPHTGFTWLGGDALFLSSRSSIGLRRSGALRADDWVLNEIKTEIIDEQSPHAPRVTCVLQKDYSPMHDRDNTAYNGYVDHFSGCDNSDIVLTQTGGMSGSVAASVADDKKVTLRIHHISFPGGYKDVTVYLNRTLWKDNVVFTDRFVGATETYDTSPDNWYTWNIGNSMGIYGFDGHCPAGYRHLRFDDEWNKWGESNPAFDTWETREKNTTLGELGFKDKATGNTLYFVMEGVRIAGLSGTYRVIQDGNSTDLGGPGNKPLHGVAIYVSGCTLTDPTSGHHGYQRGAEFKVFWWGFHHYYIQGDEPGLNSDVADWYYLNRGYKIRCVRSKTEFH